jgi:hypothetical protein
MMQAAQFAGVLAGAANMPRLRSVIEIVQEVISNSQGIGPFAPGPGEKGDKERPQVIELKKQPDGSYK